jgi:hypothetical protein
VTAHTVRSGSFRRPEDARDTPLLSVRLQSTAADGAPDAALALTVNPQRADGSSSWDAEDLCAAPGTVLLAERFQRLVHRPECLRVRAVPADGAAGVAGPPLPAWSSPLAPDRPLPRGWEIHYARYDLAGMVTATWWLPHDRLASDRVAVAWAHEMAHRLAPLADIAGPGTATMPPLGPAR